MRYRSLAACLPFGGNATGMIAPVWRALTNSRRPSNLLTDAFPITVTRRIAEKRWGSEENASRGNDRDQLSQAFDAATGTPAARHGWWKGSQKFSEDVSSLNDLDATEVDGVNFLLDRPTPARRLRSEIDRSFTASLISSEQAEVLESDPLAEVPMVFLTAYEVRHADNVSPRSLVARKLSPSRRFTSTRSTRKARVGGGDTCGCSTIAEIVVRAKYPVSAMMPGADRPVQVN